MEWLICIWIVVMVLILFLGGMFTADCYDDYKRAKRHGDPKEIAKEAVFLRRMILFLVFSPLWFLYVPIILLVFLLRIIKDIFKFMQTLNSEIKGEKGL